MKLSLLSLIFFGALLCPAFAHFQEGSFVREIANCNHSLSTDSIKGFNEVGFVDMTFWAYEEDDVTDHEKESSFLKYFISFHTPINPFLVTDSLFKARFLGRPVKSYRSCFLHFISSLKI